MRNFKERKRGAPSLTLRTYDAALHDLRVRHQLLPSDKCVGPTAGAFDVAVDFAGALNRSVERPHDMAKSRQLGIRERLASAITDPLSADLVSPNSITPDLRRDAVDKAFLR